MNTIARIQRYRRLSYLFPIHGWFPKPRRPAGPSCFEAQTVVARATANIQPSLRAAGDAPLLRLALESVSDVHAEPIHPSRYLDTVPRTLNAEEASALVFAIELLKCNADTCALDSFLDVERPVFFGFRALRENPSGNPILGAFETDPPTGDV